jgi:hypothetical protein
MIKDEIRGYILGFVGREDATQRFHPRWVDSVIERVLLEMYAELFKVNPLLLDKYTKQFGVPTALTIASETGTGLYYTTLPAQVVSLPDKASGVRHIYPFTPTGDIFMPMDAREASLVANTDVNIVNSKIGYRVRQDKRVDYYKMNVTVLNVGVRMDLLIPFSEYLDTDNVLIPEMTTASTSAVVGFTDRVLAYLGITTPANLEDDNGPTKAQANTK